MANPEHVEQLKRSAEEGNIDKWNLWRQEHPEIQIDLSRADLTDAKLANANLMGADLSNAILIGTILSGANLHEVNLSGAILTRTDLSDVNLSGAYLGWTYNPRGYSAKGYLSGAYLNGTNLNRAILTRTHFSDTTFAGVDLNRVQGLETSIYTGLSTVNINSVVLPTDAHTRKHFLRGVGFTDTQIDYLPSLLTPRPIQFHSLFISYAHQDKIIAEQIYTDLRKNDILCWFAPHELIPGDYYRHKIDEAIHAHDKLVLILSEHSIKSQWVEKEVETALKREESMDMAQQVLFPIRLDDTVMTTSRRWISSLRYHRHIGNFTNWQNKTAYNQAFTTLLQHLKVSKQ